MLFDPHDADYSEIISRIVADLRGRYALALGFRPDSTGGETRRRALKVEVVRPGARVRARKEYSGPYLQNCSVRVRSYESRKSSEPQ
jgi:hypothetical protein